MDKSKEMQICPECLDVVIYCKCYEDMFSMDESASLKKARELANIHHKGQIDKAGKPYIQHPLRVMNAMETDNEKIVALLHDIIEDSSLTINDLLKEGFSLEVINALSLLTKTRDIDYFEYIKNIVENPIARKVKLADLEDNMDLTRLSAITKKDKKRVEKYRKAKEILIG